MAGAGAAFFGNSATIASVVIRRPATDAAPCNAARTTLVGSMMPFDIMLHAQEILNMKKRLNEIYVHHTGQSLKKIEDALERDHFLTAEMAVAFGVVDKVIDQRPTQPATAAA